MKVEVGKRYLTNAGDSAFVFAQDDRDGSSDFVCVLIGKGKFWFYLNKDGAEIRGEFCLILCLDDEIRITADDVGKRVKLRNGEIAFIYKFHNEGYPYAHTHAEIRLYDDSSSIKYVFPDGRQSNQYDIVEILEDEPEERKDFKVKTTKKELEKILELIKNSELSYLLTLDKLSCD